MLFTIEIETDYIPTSSESVCLSTLSANTYCFQSLDVSHSQWCEITSCFDLQLSDETIFHMPTICVFSLEKCLFISSLHF